MLRQGVTLTAEGSVKYEKSLSLWIDLAVGDGHSEKSNPSKSSPVSAHVVMGLMTGFHHQSFLVRLSSYPCSASAP